MENSKKSNFGKYIVLLFHAFGMYVPDQSRGTIDLGHFWSGFLFGGKSILVFSKLVHVRALKTYHPAYKIRKF